MPEPTGQPDRPALSSAQRRYEHRVGVTFTVNAPDASLAVSAVKRVLMGAQLIGLTVHSPQREALILSWRLAGTVAPAPAAEPTGPSCTTMGHEHLAATHVGRYDDGQTVEDGVAYCAECATVMRGEFTPAEPGQQRAAEGLARHLTPAQRLADAQAQVAALHADVERLTAERDAARDTALSEAQERIHVERFILHGADSHYGGMVHAEGTVQDMRGEGEPRSMALENADLRAEVAALRARQDDVLDVCRAEESKLDRIGGLDPVDEYAVVTTAEVRAALGSAL